MSNDFRKYVWLRAKREADEEVMRLTATVTGGRKPTEGIREYVARVREAQEAALQRWATACEELQKLEAPK